MNLKQKIKKNLSTWAYYTCLIIGAILGLYVMFWVMIIDPIINCINAMSVGTLTTSQVLITILSCVFSVTFGCIVASIFAFVGVLSNKIIDDIMEEIFRDKK